MSGQRTQERPNRLREFRLAKGLVQADIAAALGMRESSFAKIERGDANPSFPVAQRIAAFFGVGIDDLWPRDGHA